ncbi:MAG TPA: sigma-54-dependent Fis family transcriptional regulator [Firmicutes bacterium]|nr:sigma-54-dependent Fis family transcriptional regulator [Bacillota bacterium]
MCDFLEVVLREEGYLVSSVTSGTDALERIAQENFDVIITDLMMPGVDGMRVLEESKRQSPETAVIMITGFSTVDSAVMAMKKGAFDYLPKPFKIDEIKVVVGKALDQRRILAENRRLRDELRAARGRSQRLIGNSEGMRKVYELIEKVARSDSTVLIRGESGTGKDLVARAIHEASPRADKPYLSINCAALPETLLESELFGHARGAFTGAVSAKRGLLEEAASGTVFLDEIGDISLGLQAKLLRFLQDREFIRVGETTPRRVDVRVVVATNRNLEEAIARGAFREDLYYRLNVITINLPPLRERKDDIPVLAKYFAGRLWQKLGKGPTRFSDEAMAALVAYDWPGNVRELENVVERAMILGEGSTIELKDLTDAVREALKAPAGARDGAGSRQDVSSAGTGILHAEGSRRQGANSGYENLNSTSFRQAVEEFERKLILAALEETGWVQTRAAERLGLKKTTLSEMMKRLGIRDSERFVQKNGRNGTP